MSVGYGYCFAALAANEQLDVAGAEAHLRHAVRIASLPSGRPTYIAKLAGSLLGELLYEHGRIDEAETLLDDAYELGAEGGTVDILLATYGTGARLKLTRGNAAAAHRRLADGLEIARQLQLQRLKAGLLKESARIAASSGEPIDDSLAAQIMSHGAQQLEGTGGDTAEFMEDSQIRLLLLDGKPSAVSEACRRARTRLDQVDRNRRPRAHLTTTIQLALCLAVAGDTHEAQCVLRPALRACAALGLSQPLIDEGVQILRLAYDATIDTTDTVDDAIAFATIRDFVLNLAGTSSEAD
jgi:serine/threonine-protein kinase/serine/threonine-protein kinase PknK